MDFLVLTMIYVFRNPQIKPRLEEVRGRTRYFVVHKKGDSVWVPNQRNAAVWITKDGNSLFLLQRPACPVPGHAEEWGTSCQRLSVSVDQASHSSVNKRIHAMSCPTLDLVVKLLVSFWLVSKIKPSRSSRYSYEEETLVWSDFTPLLLPPSADCSVLIHTQFAPGPGQVATKCQTQIRFWKTNHKKNGRT